MNAVIYCRVSTKEQVSNLSLGTQEKHCREYCNREGYEVLQVFVEEGESAKSAERTQLKLLMEHCRANKRTISVVVVYNLSRFCRSSHDHQVIRAYLAALGITLRSATEPIDDTATGKLMEAILSGMAQFDNDLRSDRTKVGMQAALAQGRWTFGPPIGYLKPALSGQGPSLIPDPERASLVRQAFEMYATGLHSKAEVLDRVTALGLRTRRDRPISSQTFNSMLRNCIYVGRVVVAGWDIDSPGDFEAIVGERTFGKVQSVLAGRSTTAVPRSRNNPGFPLRQYVRCGRCGVPLTGSFSRGRSKRYAYYHCRTKGCSGGGVSAGDLHRKFEVLLGTLQPTRSCLGLLRAIVADVFEVRATEGAMLRKSLERRQEDLLRRKDELIEAHVHSRLISKADFERNRDRLEEEIALVRLEIFEATLAQYDVEGALAFAEEVLADTPRLWGAYDLEQKQRFQSLIFPDGLDFDGEEFRTARTCSVFSYLRGFAGGTESLASPTGLEPVLPP